MTTTDQKCSAIIHKASPITSLGFTAIRQEIISNELLFSATHDGKTWIRITAEAYIAQAHEINAPYYEMLKAGYSLEYRTTQTTDLDNDRQAFEGCPECSESGHTACYQAARAESAREIEELKHEIDEQCRINAMGGERELKLMAQVEELKRDAALNQQDLERTLQLANDFSAEIERWRARCIAAQNGHPQVKFAVEQKEAEIERLKAENSKIREQNQGLADALKMDKSKFWGLVERLEKNGYAIPDEWFDGGLHKEIERLQRVVNRLTYEGEITDIVSSIEIDGEKVSNLMAVAIGQILAGWATTEKESVCGCVLCSNGHDHDHYSAPDTRAVELVRELRDVSRTVYEFQDCAGSSDWDALDDAIAKADAFLASAPEAKPELNEDAAVEIMAKAADGCLQDGYDVEMRAAYRALPQQRVWTRSQLVDLLREQGMQADSYYEEQADALIAANAVKVES
jgi:hypothetical protein